MSQHGPQLKDVTEGQTEVVVHQLLNDGLPVLIFGLTVTLVLQDKNGTPISTVGKVTNLDDNTLPNKGKVSFSPAAGDFVDEVSEYYWKWKVVDGSGKVGFWPNGAAAKLKIFPQGKI